MTPQFSQRLLSASIAICLLAVAIYFSQEMFFRPFFLLFNLIIINLALLEYYQLGLQKKLQPLVILGLICSTLYLTASYFSFLIPGLPALALLMILGVMFIPFFRSPSQSIQRLSITTFGLLYLTLPLSCLLLLSAWPPDGRLWLTYTLAVTKMSDVGAYFSGKALGKHPLAPSISPKKTIEGTIGGIISGFLTSVAFYALLANTTSFRLQLHQGIGLGLLIPMVAQFGDLTESILKRDAGVKDSSRLPGLGGLLDIVDSLIFTAPLVYLLLYIHIIGS